MASKKVEVNALMWQVSQLIELSLFFGCLTPRQA